MFDSILTSANALAAAQAQHPVEVRPSPASDSSEPSLSESESESIEESQPMEELRRPAQPVLFVRPPQVSLTHLSLRRASEEARGSRSIVHH